MALVAAVVTRWCSSLRAIAGLVSRVATCCLISIVVKSRCSVEEIANFHDEANLKEGLQATLCKGRLRRVGNNRVHFDRSWCTIWKHLDSIDMVSGLSY